jgi:hypothetical protein
VSEAETTFRSVLDEEPRSTLVDDAALGLARSLVAQGASDAARAVIEDATQRTAGRGRFLLASGRPSLSIDELGALRGDALAARLRDVLRDAPAGSAPLGLLLDALADRYAAPALEELRGTIGGEPGIDGERAAAPPPAQASRTPDREPRVAPPSTAQRPAIASSAPARLGAPASPTAPATRPGTVSVGALLVAGALAASLVGWLALRSRPAAPPPPTRGRRRGRALRRA